jgi:tripartite-type tricarboxylate transporter receptor subunit TctC
MIRRSPRPDPLARRARVLAPLAGLAAAALCASGSARAQTYPVRPIRLIVPGPPGDGSDLVARAVGQHLSQAWGQSVVVENRVGAGGRIGTEAAVRAAPDGYTLLMGNAGSNGINAAIYPGLPYDLERDVEPITQVMRAPNVLVVNPSLGVSDVAQWVALLKANPGKYAYGSGGVGSSAHLSAELFKLMAGVDLLHVPYKGAGPALNAVMAGEVAMFLGNLPPAAGHIRTGRVKALGVTTAARTPLLPEAPTLDETGLKGFETVAWFGLFAPKGTPAELIVRIRNEVASGVATPEMARLIGNVGGEPVAGTPEAFRAIVQSDIAKWKRVVAAAGIKAE